jgi:hypothetical protein
MHLKISRLVLKIVVNGKIFHIALFPSLNFSV